MSNTVTAPDKKTTLLNIPKFQQITSRIFSYLKYQSNPYDFEIEEPVYTFLFTLSTYLPSEIELMSMEREPIGYLMKDIVQ